MDFLGTEIAPLGMGCWPMGGPFYAGERPLGYAGVSDAQSLSAVAAALEAGIRLFDTAAVYGAGHSERLLAQALKHHPDALVVSKIGIGFDETTKQVCFDPMPAAHVMPAIEGCLRRLGRDRVDLMLLHDNARDVDEAGEIFDQMDRAVQEGKLRAHGWSTDYPASVTAMAGRPHFRAVEHAMNVFFDAPSVQGAVQEAGLIALLRSPLAMGVLGGRYGAGDRVAADDIRAVDEPWVDYFKGGAVSPEALRRLEAVRELLCTGGRTLAQGALCWLWAKDAANIPIPGARTPAQIEGTAGALAFGPLPQDVMAQIEAVIDRPPEGPPRNR